MLLLAQRLELGDGGLGGGDFRLVLLFHRRDALLRFRHQRFGDVAFGTPHDVQFFLSFEGYGLPLLFEQVFKQSQLVFVETCSRFGVVLLLALVLVVGDGAVNLRDGGFPPLLHLQQFRRVAVGEVLPEFLLEGLELLAQFLVLLRHFLHLFGAGGAVYLFDGVGHVLPHLVGEVFGRLPLAVGERLDAFNEIAVLLPDFLFVGGDLVQADEFVLLEELLHLLLEVLPFGQLLSGDLLGGLAACAPTAPAAVRLALYVGDNRVQLVADPRGEVLLHLLNLGLLLLHNLGDVANPELLLVVQLPVLEQVAVKVADDGFGGQTALGQLHRLAADFRRQVLERGAESVHFLFHHLRYLLLLDVKGYLALHGGDDLVVGLLDVEDVPLLVQLVLEYRGVVLYDFLLHLVVLVRALAQFPKCAEESVGLHFLLGGALVEVLHGLLRRRGAGRQLVDGRARRYYGGGECDPRHGVGRGVHLPDRRSRPFGVARHLCLCRCDGIDRRLVGGFDDHSDFLRRREQQQARLQQRDLGDVECQGGDDGQHHALVLADPRGGSGYGLDACRAGLGQLQQYRVELLAQFEAGVLELLAGFLQVGLHIVVLDGELIVAGHTLQHGFVGHLLRGLHLVEAVGHRGDGCGGACAVKAEVLEYGQQLVETARPGEALEDFLQSFVHIGLYELLELAEFHSGNLGELCGLGYDFLDELLESGGGHLHLLHVLVQRGGEAEDLVGGESGLDGDAAEPPREVDHVLLVGRTGLAQLVDGGTQRKELLFERLVLEHVGGLFVNVHHLADGQRCVITQHVPHGNVDDVRCFNELLHQLLGGYAQLARDVGEVVELFAAGSGVQVFEALVELLHLLASETCGLDDIGIDVVHGGEVGGHLLEGAGHVVEGGEDLRQSSDARAELQDFVVHFRPRGGGGADVLRVFLEVLPQFLDFLGMGDVLVRADDHAVLLVDELVHLGTYLLDGGFHLLAVDVDGYPAGAALCHKPVVCGKDGLNVRHGMGRHKKTAVVLIDCGFVNIVIATTIVVVTSTPVRRLNG